MTDIHDPGGKVSTPLPPSVFGAAEFGGPKDCYRYRAEYWRPDGSGIYRTLMFLMLNPSTASHLNFDPTITRCWNFAERLGFNRLVVGNTFAYRATDQMDLAGVPDPIGPANDFYLLEMATQVQKVIMAYGTPKVRSLARRGPEVARMLAANSVRMHMLELSKFGVPKHPLYLAADRQPEPWIPDFAEAA